MRSFPTKSEGRYQKNLFFFTRGTKKNTIKTQKKNGLKITVNHQMKRKVQKFIPAKAGVNDVLRITPDVWVMCISPLLNWDNLLALAATCKYLHASLWKSTPFIKSAFENRALRMFYGLAANEAVLAVTFERYLRRTVGGRNFNTRTQLEHVLPLLPRRFINHIFGSVSFVGRTKPMSIRHFLKATIMYYGTLTYIMKKHKEYVLDRKRRMEYYQSKEYQEETQVLYESLYGTTK